MYQFKLAKWGNSFAVRIPARLVKELGLEEGDLISSDLITSGAALQARLDAAREAKRMTREEAEAVMLESRKRWPIDLNPEDWKVDHDADDMRG